MATIERIRAENEELRGRLREEEKELKVDAGDLSDEQKRHQTPNIQVEQIITK